MLLAEKSQRYKIKMCRFRSYVTIWSNIKFREASLSSKIESTVPTLARMILR